MKAAVLRDGVFSVETVVTPEPGAGQVLVRILACGICGSDLHLFKHAADIVRLAEELGAPPDDITKGLVLGHEFVGEIMAFGPGCSRQLALHDRVCAMPFVHVDGATVAIGATTRTTGAYAQFMVLPEAGLLRVRDGVPTEAAALTEPFAIAVHALNQARLTGTEEIVVIGCGPIGLAIIALVQMHNRIRKTHRIVASDPSTARRNLALGLGADTAVDPREESPFTHLQSSRPAAIFECVGAPGLIGQIVRETPARSRVVVAGICQGEDHFLPMLAIAKELCLQFVSYYEPDEFTQALELLSSGHVDWRPFVTANVDLDGIADAFAALRADNGHAKILIRPSGCEATG